MNGPVKIKEKEKKLTRRKSRTEYEYDFSVGRMRNVVRVRVVVWRTWKVLLV